MKILIVDDEQDICEILQYNLELEGYEVVTANSAEEALELVHSAEFKVHSYLPDLILLDVMMEGMSGFQMARRLKDDPETARIPIIFITALDSEDDIVRGLNIGADDYIAKPLSMKEVKARVKAVMRRVENPLQAPQPDILKQVKSKGGETPSLDSCSTELHSPSLGGGGVCLNLDAKTATLDGQLLTLTKLEFELLSLLLEHPNRVFSRDELLKRCWPEDVYVLDRTVDVNITRLRKKIGRYGKLLKTRVGYGYYFSS